MCLYVLFYIGLMRPQSRTVTVSPVSHTDFAKLNVDYGETLTCPCAKATVLYKAFTLNTIAFHPVCSSVFVRAEWIGALHMADASRYGAGDFRTTASSQVRKQSLH